MKLLVVIASTRPGRVGGVVGQWFVTQAIEHGGFEVEVADLAEIKLPFHDEPAHPRTGQYVHQHTREWSALVAGADAFAFVMPEYNFSFNAALKNALDYLNLEWAYKPVAFVSYGGMSGGIRAVQMLKQVVTTLRMIPVTDAVSIPMVHSMVEEGVFHPTEIIESSAKVVLDELAKFAPALAGLRADA